MPFSFFFKRKQLPKLPISTEIHCHVIPGVDDGSPCVETSLELLNHMADWGIQRVFASPHSTLDTFENTPQIIAEPFAQLADAVKKKDLPLELDYHFEYRIDEFFLRQLKAGNIKPLPGRYILIENSFSQEPWGLDGFIYDLTMNDYIPILAHPERYRYYHRHLNRYNELYDKGIRFQINLLSLAEHYGAEERKVALYLMKKGMVDFVGSDVHRASHVASIERYLRSSKYRKDLKLLGNLRNDTI